MQEGPCAGAGEAACGEERRRGRAAGLKPRVAGAPAALRQPSHTAPPQHTAPTQGAGTRVGLGIRAHDPEDTHTQRVRKRRDSDSGVNFLNLRRTGGSSHPQIQHRLVSSHSGPLNKGNACVSLRVHGPRSSGQAPSEACLPHGGARPGTRPRSGPPPMALQAEGPGYPRSHLLTGRASPGQAVTPVLGNTGRAAS